ncbi:hypothetical protein K3495_g12898 [Podosphaera aphanis]|nr:hypothetical protein K3495_g12898 [Podosphaera aphanis]
MIKYVDDTWAGKRTVRPTTDLNPALVQNNQHKVQPKVPDNSWKAKVVVPVNLKLRHADDTVLQKLHEIQLLFKHSFFPYDLWAQRTSAELSGDFHLVKEWTDRACPSWTDFVEAIIQILDKYKSVHSAFSAFATLLPFKDEAYGNYAERLRDAFYRLGDHQRYGEGTRSLIIHKIQIYQPSVYAEFLSSHRDLTNVEIIEETVLRAKLHDKKAVEAHIYSNPSASVQLHGTTAPFYDLKISAATAEKPGQAQITPRNASDTSVIADPRTEERTVHPAHEDEIHVNCGHCGAQYTGDSHCGVLFVGAARETDNKCFNCGKMGHWAKNCHQKTKFSRNQSSVSSSSSGQKVTLKGLLFKDDKARNLFRSNRFGRDSKKGKGRPRVHLAGHDDEYENQNTIDRLEDDTVDADLEFLLHDDNNE